MSAGNAFSPNHREDLYPSRKGRGAIQLERLDPVVYATNYQEGPISPELVARYDDQGFLILENVFASDEIDLLRQELERLKQDENLKSSEKTIREPDNGDLRSVFEIHHCSPLFSRLAADSRLAGLAQFLLNEQVYIHQSRLNYKPGFQGKEFYWHSDFETWHVEDGMPRMRALSMSVTLTENYECNGPLMLIPGSHRQYLSCEGTTPSDHYKRSLKKQEYGVPSQDFLRQMVNQGGIVSAIGKPGSVIVFDCNLMHGSNGNITPYPRSNAFFVYNALSNRVEDPFCDQPPRPEHICSRQRITPVNPTANRFTS